MQGGSGRFRTRDPASPPGPLERRRSPRETEVPARLRWPPPRCLLGAAKALVRGFATRVRAANSYAIKSPAPQSRGLRIRLSAGTEPVSNCAPSPYARFRAGPDPPLAACPRRNPPSGGQGSEPAGAPRPPVPEHALRGLPRCAAPDRFPAVSERGQAPGRPAGRDGLGLVPAPAATALAPRCRNRPLRCSAPPLVGVRPAELREFRHLIFRKSSIASSVILFSTCSQLERN